MSNQPVDAEIPDCATGNSDTDEITIAYQYLGKAAQATDEETIKFYVRQAGQYLVEYADE
ncbi:hypothetical protein K0C01_12000 [Salinarchaeum sp. IM2453]|uniref:hypothetical protein n=1 Tax=Salinarchaeum sp. IM2453 TaxID=2862870 RepID=UPI001C83630E|nr:hypothetical protein [Salinarchaeum sp. IM2453]QZA88485.1 hypothetical protein K0C01_12000 [Salinarchaeum sp. IM2453]